MLHGLREEQDRRKAALADLRKNIKDYPKGLLQLRDRIAAELKQHIGQSVPIDILADVLEIPETEEHWRNAVEGYLNTQKFYLLIPPEYYQRALTLSSAIITTALLAWWILPN